MSEVVRIRWAVREDISALLQLIREFALFERLDHSLGVSEDSLENALFSSEAFCKCFIVEIEKAVVGYAIFYPCFRTFSGLKTLYLEDLYIRPGFRNGGLGKDVLKSISEYALLNGFSRIDFQVLNWNERAVGFYEHLGAKRVDGNLDYSIDIDSLKNMIK